MRNIDQKLLTQQCCATSLGFLYPVFRRLKGHSVCGAVTTEVARQGFSIPEILQFSDWSQESTFTKFYYQPQFDPSAGSAVLASTTQNLMQYSFEQRC